MKVVRKRVVDRRVLMAVRACGDGSEQVIWRWACVT